MVNDIICKRCGRCCHFIADGKVRKCKHLVMLGKVSLCRIFNKRLGQIIYVDKKGEKTYCGMRENIKSDYKGCPFNKGYPIKDVGF